MCRLWLTAAIALHVAFTSATCLIKCPNSGPAGPAKAVETTFYEFGEPVMVVTTSSKHFDPYRLLDTYRSTSVEDEYLMVGYHGTKNNTKYKGQLHDEIQMLLYDRVKMVDASPDDALDLVHQNLEKELHWKYFNACGIIPQLTIANSTMRKSINFETGVQGDEVRPINYTATLKVWQHYWEPQVPYTAVFEIPSNSRTLRKEMTLIEYQSFTLWRWKLSETVKTWDEIESTTDEYAKRSTSTNLYRIDNPCMKDLFLMYTPRSERGNPDKKLVYLASPLIQSRFHENFFYDMNSPDQPWSPDGPKSMVLTNDHLVVLTEKGLWISASLNNTPNDLSMKSNYTDRPRLTYVKVDPCELYEDTIDCFIPEPTPYNSKNLTFKKSTSHTLSYTPICYLNQLPWYDDYLIFVTERTRTMEGQTEELKDFTVMFAKRPYNSWSILFSVVSSFVIYDNDDSHEGSDVHTHTQRINNIIGIFFNHHVRHFDITMYLTTESDKNEYLRFVLPDPPDIFDGYGVPMTREQIEDHTEIKVSLLNAINSTIGEGFSDFRFPPGFELTDIVVAGDTLDIFFLGNQLWISEAAGPTIYLALSKLYQPDNTKSQKPFCDDMPQFSNGKIKECSFNHPDKTFVCTNEDRRLLAAGKVGSLYTVHVFEMEKIPELINAQRVNPWPIKYFCEILQKKSIFAAGFSGRILMWFIEDPEKVMQAIQTGISTGCPNADAEPELCEEIQLWQQKGCSVVKSGAIEFGFIAIDPRQLALRQDSCDGPLVPFLVDANTAVLYEAVIEGTENYAYFDETFVGRQIFCRNYELLVADINDDLKKTTCELFVRHIKPVDSYLEGFKKSVYVTIVRSIPLLTVPVDVVVLVFEASNQAFVQINDADKYDPPWTFSDEHIGQTLFFPGNFSMLLRSFPRGLGNRLLMDGLITRHFQRQRRFVFQAFGSYLMDMSTKTYRQTILDSINDIVAKNDARMKRTDGENEQMWKVQIQMHDAVQKLWEESPYADASIKLYKYDLQNDPPIKTVDKEDELLKTRDEEKSYRPGGFEESAKQAFPIPWPPRDLGDPALLVYGIMPYDEKLIWYVDEEECDYVISLVHNAVLITPGGRISLDLYDRLSFEVTLRPLTALGKLLMYRPLLDVTNSNPKILRVETEEKQRGSPQFIQFYLSPTGFGRGTAVLTVRSRLTSMKCPYLSSVTFTVSLHREVGRRLHVTYPIPTCPPEEKHGMFPRPWWHKPTKGCIEIDSILHDDKITRVIDGVDTILYENLEVNYRPPSHDGENVPLSRNVYNADPSKPGYHDLYVASKESVELNRCAGASKKSECRCQDVSHKVSDDEQFAECKEKVYLVKRAQPVFIQIVYDRIMRDQDQNPSMFIPKLNWSATIEEVNGREEWFITFDYSPYINAIHADENLHNGLTHYEMSNLSVVLVGTGLFHFKVRLPVWESFDPVVGYFMLYSKHEGLNHMHMIMILFGTIILCLTFVFIGFVVNRKRLTGLLPIQPVSRKKKLKLV